MSPYTRYVVKLTIGPSRSSLIASTELMRELHEHFSFRDKSAETEMFRLKKSLQFKERALFQENDGELPEWYLEWKKERFAQLLNSLDVYACELKDGKLIVPTGLARSLIEFLNEKQIAVEVDDQRDFSRPRRKLTGEPPPKLRVPQKEAQDVVLNAQGIAKGNGLIRLATGVGKTALAQELIRTLGHKSIFLVPSLPILRQTIKRFESAFGKKNVKAYGGGKKQLGYVTVATYQSVYKGNPKDFAEIDTVIGDECHHVSADTFFDVMMSKMQNAVHRYGLTAFEERADNSTLLIEAALGPVVYKYDAPQAIADGYLAKPTFMIYDVLDTRGQWTEYKIRNGVRTMTGVKPSVHYDGDNDMIAYRNWVLGNDILNNFVTNMTSEFVQSGQSILILVDEKEHGDRLQKLLNESGVTSGYCIGGGKDNEEHMKEFNARRLKVLIGTSTLGEGADTVPVDVLINLAGGASKSKTLQSNGRALRNDPDENGVARKPTSLIIDFDFPHSKMLTRHSKERLKIHKALGEIHKSTIS